MNWVTTLQELQHHGTPTAVVTIVKTRGSTPRNVGTKMLVTENEFFGTVGGGQLEELVMQKAREILTTHLSPQRVPYPLCLEANQCCGGLVEVFIETVHAGPHLLLFGAGHVAQAVAKVLEGTPFVVHMIDPRAEWLEKASSTVIRHQDRGLEFIKNWRQWHSQKTYAVVMTFDHDLDQELVEKILEKDRKYLGLIGSTTKWRRFQSRLLQKGYEASKLVKVKCPIGLPIGGKSPQEVAISFAAELVQIQNESLKSSHTQAKSFHTDNENSWQEELS